MQTRGKTNVETYTAVELVDLVDIEDEDEEFEVVSRDAELEVIARSNSEEPSEDG